MTLDPAPDSAPGLVVCVGLPADQIIEIAHLLRGRATVLATPDAEGARAVLDNHASPRLPSGAPWRGAGPQAERYDNPGPADDRAYGRHLPERPVDRFPESDNLMQDPSPGTAEGISTAPSPTSPAPGTSDGLPDGTPDRRADGGAAGRSGRFRPTPGSVLARPVLYATIPPGPRETERFSAGAGAGGAVGTGTGSVPMVAPPTVEPLVAGPLFVDLAGREVIALGRRVYLSAREFDLLATLALEIGRVWSFAELTARVWQLPYLGDSDPVTSAVKRLRKRLAPVRDVEVASVRGVGYRLKVRG